jgi:hypothetical protein
LYASTKGPVWSFTTRKAAGSLTVTINSDPAGIAGAMWNVDGGPWQAGGATVGGLAVGSHTVSFKPVAGWTTPENQTVAVTDGKTSSADGLYVQQTGSLSVTISPTPAIDAGAQWKVDSGSWQSSGATVKNLPVGSHTVSFRAITGWTTPASKTVTVTNDKTATATGKYVQTAPPPSNGLSGTWVGTYTDYPEYAYYECSDISSYEDAGTVTMVITQSPGTIPDAFSLSGTVTMTDRHALNVPCGSTPCQTCNMVEYSSTGTIGDTVSMYFSINGQVLIQTMDTSPVNASAGGAIADSFSGTYANGVIKGTLNTGGTFQVKKQ